MFLRDIQAKSGMVGNYGSVPWCFFLPTHRVITGKAPQSLDFGTLQDGALSGIASKCGAHGGINTVYGTPR